MLEIADNRWELSATKAPLTTPGGIAQMVLMSGFALFFVWIFVFSVIAIVTPKGEGLAGEYRKLQNQDPPAAPSAP